MFFLRHLRFLSRSLKYEVSHLFLVFHSRRWPDRKVHLPDPDKTILPLTHCQLHTMVRFQDLQHHYSLDHISDYKYHTHHDQF